MRIAFVGKGGSGKTSLSGCFIRHLAKSGAPVIAIDGDVNQHLDRALGFDKSRLEGRPKLGDHIPELKDFFRGANPRIASAEVMLKTTPAGRGSRLVRFMGNDWFHQTFLYQEDNIAFAGAGDFTGSDVGVACYHSKTGAIEYYLNHLIDGPGEYVVVDMTAGADLFASPLFTKFDVIVVVCNPSVQSIDVYEQCQHYGRDFGLNLQVVANRVIDSDDLEFMNSAIRDLEGNSVLPIATVWQSAHLRAVDRGERFDIGKLEPHNLDALNDIKVVLDKTTKDWRRYQQTTHDLHLKNAEAWAGTGAIDQIDPYFDLEAHALARVS